MIGFRCHGCGRVIWPWQLRAVLNTHAYHRGCIFL